MPMGTKKRSPQPNQDEANRAGGRGAKPRRPGAWGLAPRKQASEPGLRVPQAEIALVEWAADEIPHQRRPAPFA